MVKEIDSKEMLLQLLEAGAYLVDVREEEEISTGALDFHAHWPLSSFALRQEEISRLRPTIFYCRSGVRSFKAAEIASEWTTQEVYCLQGGYMRFKELAQRS